MSDQIAQGIQSRHFQTNTVLSRLSAGRVQGITMVQVTWQPGSTDSTPIIKRTGYYLDEFVRNGNAWQFARRRAYTDQ